MAVEVRTIVESELQSYVDSVQRGFGGEMIEGELERVREVLGLDRVHGAFDGQRIVGTIGSYSFPLGVPGPTDVQAAGLTRVTVSAAHRRRGILTSMMDTHFDDAVDNGEALSVLWASEAAIYGRFGYGPASEMLTATFDTRATRIIRPEQPDELDQIPAEEAEKLIPELRERIRAGRPGQFGRSEAWWRLRRFPDHEAAREGGSPRRHVLATRNGQPVGYASYRHKSKWDDDDLPQGTIMIIETGGIDAAAEHTIWWYLCNIDLFPNVECWSLPTDSTLPWLMENPRAMRRRVSDCIHLRVLDVAASLSARRYQVPGDTVFAISDDRRPTLAGGYRLSVADDGTATCSPSDDQPTLTLSAYALATLYFGSVGPEGPALRGHISGHDRSQPDPLGSLRRTFAWPVAAWCDEMF